MRICCWSNGLLRYALRAPLRSPLPFHFGSERRRGSVAKRRVRSLPVVVFHPSGDLDPSMVQAPEQRLVEQFVPHSTVEALDVAILHRLSRRDVMLLDADLAAPCQYAIAGELGSVFADDHAGLATQRAISSASFSRRPASSSRVGHALAIGIDDTARPPFAHPVARLEMSNRLPLRGGQQNFFARRSFKAA